MDVQGSYVRLLLQIVLVLQLSCLLVAGNSLVHTAETPGLSPACLQHLALDVQLKWLIDSRSYSTFSIDCQGFVLI